MCQRIAYGHLEQLVWRSPPKWSAAGCQYDPLDFLNPTSSQCLKDCTMFTVDRQDAGIALFGELDNQLSTHDQRFFVGQSNRFPGFQRMPGAAQASTSNNSRQYDIDIGTLNDLP